MLHVINTNDLCTAHLILLPFLFLFPVTFPLLFHLPLSFQIPVTFPDTAPEIAIPELDGKTAKMFRCTACSLDTFFNDTAVCVRSPCHCKVYWSGSIKMSCHLMIGVLLCVGWAYMCTHSTYVYVCVSMTLYVSVCMCIHNIS